MYIDNIRMHSQLRKTDLFILPETIVPEFLLSDKEFMFSLRDAIDATVIFGTPRFRDRSIDNRYYNAVVLMNKYGDVTALHDKKYLVPFGEYIPGRKYLYWMFESTGFLQSEYSIPSQNKSKADYGSAVCFESTFPYQLREHTRDGAQLLLVLTNDAWFKHTEILEIHLAYAVFRAVENNRYLLQSANTGLSAIIDNRGRILAQSQMDERQWLEGSVKLLMDKTIYTVVGEIAVYLAMVYFVFSIYFVLLGLGNKQR